jgi:hypothetical protein
MPEHELKRHKKRRKRRKRDEEEEKNKTQYLLAKLSHKETGTVRTTHKVTLRHVPAIIVVVEKQ